MKKSSLLVTALLAVALTACGKNDDPAPVAAPVPAQQPAASPVQEAEIERAEEPEPVAGEATEDATAAAEEPEPTPDAAAEAGELAQPETTETAVMAAAPLSADDAAKLAQAKNCMACHAVDRKLVGPSYQEVAEKRAGEEGALALLTDKIQKGGSGEYGPVPMPPNPQVTAEEASQLAQWVLDMK